MDENQFVKTTLSDLKNLCYAYSLAFADSANVKLAFQQIENQLKTLLEQMATTIESEVVLSPKEKEVLIHVSNGFTNREISQALSVSEKTIEFHLSSIYRKLSVSNRSEAIARAIRDRII